MASWWFIALGCALTVAGLAATGWWRLALLPLTIRASKMTVSRLGLLVKSPVDASRVDHILGSFAGGFNAMLVGPSWRAWQRYCAKLSPRYRPFAEEGAAMGWTARRLMRYDAGQFEREIVKPRPEFRYLYYVGLGFWSGIRNHSPLRLQRIVEGLDPLHRYLCFDGYGFKHAFFDYLKGGTDKPCLSVLDVLPGYARNAAYQGVGRAFWFLFMDEPQTFIAHAAKLGEYAADVAAGAGLASVFVNPDRLEVARRFARAMPADWQPHFHLGMCFALKARSINDVEQFERDMEGLDRSVQDAVWASVRECDRVELLVRAERRADGYAEWRTRVTEWMTRNIEYPLAAVRRARSSTAGMPGHGEAQRPADEAVPASRTNRLGR